MEVRGDTSFSNALVDEKQFVRKGPNIEGEILPNIERAFCPGWLGGGGGGWDVPERGPILGKMHVDLSLAMMAPGSSCCTCSREGQRLLPLDKDEKWTQF